MLTEDQGLPSVACCLFRRKIALQRYNRPRGASTAGLQVVLAVPNQCGSRSADEFHPLLAIAIVEIGRDHSRVLMAAETVLFLIHERRHSRCLIDLRQIAVGIVGIRCPVGS